MGTFSLEPYMKADSIASPPGAPRNPHPVIVV